MFTPRANQYIYITWYSNTRLTLVNILFVFWTWNQSSLELTEMDDRHFDCALVEFQQGR